MGKTGRIIGFGLSLAIVVFSGLKLYGIYSEYSTGTKMYGDVADQYVQVSDNGLDGFSGKSESDQDREVDATKDSKNLGAEIIEPSMDPHKVPITIDFASLKTQYPDLVGWLYCADTPINYPVVQSEDNDYYLYRLMDGTENKNGTIFMDFRNDSEFGDWNHLIYGHNMKNGAMFGSLTSYMEQEFYERHPFWFLLTEDVNYRIDLVGGYVTPATSDAYALPEDTAGRDRLYQKASRSSVFDADIKLIPEERLITMSTCVYDYEDARFVLVGVLREVVDHGAVEE